MNTIQIANAIYGIVLDMDYMDYSEQVEKEIDMLVNDLEKIKGTSLYNALELIAMKEED